METLTFISKVKPIAKRSQELLDRAIKHQAYINSFYEAGKEVLLEIRKNFVTCTISSNPFKDLQ